MKSLKIIAITTLLVLTPILHPGTQVKASPNTTLSLAIHPLECSVERIDDGLHEVIRVTPEVCQRAVTL